MEDELHSSLISSCNQTFEMCSSNLNIDGMSKLMKSCAAEKKFLEKKNHYSLQELKSTNLVFIQGLLFCALFLKNVSAVLKHFSGLKHGITVDVIFNGGSSWAKVITKSSKTLKILSDGQCQYGTKPLTKQAQEYLNLANLNTFNFNIPKVYFIFFYEVPQKLKNLLLKMNINILMSDEFLPNNILASKLCSCLFQFHSSIGSNETSHGEISSSSDDDDSNSDKNSDDYSGDDTNDQSGKFVADCNFSITESQMPLETDQTETMQAVDVDNAKLFHSLCSVDCICKTYVSNLVYDSSEKYPGKANLDITTMIALCSNLCHGGCHVKFQQNYLTLQANDEKLNPQLPLIFHKLIGRKICACESAVKIFKEIVDVVGGNNEKNRAKVLLDFLQIIPDQPSEKFSSFHSSRVNERSICIFGTGDNIKALTLTANQGFVRALQQKGVNLVVALHHARCFTEQKEVDA
ncbi:hypothetical protein HELRODRAFT_159243 [Helobdella robusta]|uniref:DUF1308 domain-containing protein n=1 Tax=Helobdella robusta TaxID=6412 RepID=T1ENS5_HELRO|nr:hypothetical protein HELRODRAFT_159243 [Helobdella robusta]ESO12666.1 hypothetical protein HELRODRAFT_159243 [Helobdella robusta]